MALLLQHSGPTFGSNQLHQACTVESPSVETVRLLLDHGATPNRGGVRLDSKALCRVPVLLRVTM
jgi:hypothetical protein